MKYLSLAVLVFLANLLQASLAEENVFSETVGGWDDAMKTRNKQDVIKEMLPASDSRSIPSNRVFRSKVDQDEEVIPANFKNKFEEMEIFGSFVPVI